MASSDHRPFGDFFRQVAEMKRSLSRPAHTPQKGRTSQTDNENDATAPVLLPVAKRADPFSVGGTTAEAAQAAVEAGGAVSVYSWELDVFTPPAVRRRRLRRAGHFTGFTFIDDTLCQTDERYDNPDTWNVGNN